VIDHLSETRWVASQRALAISWTRQLRLDGKPRIGWHGPVLLGPDLLRSAPRLAGAADVETAWACAEAGRWGMATVASTISRLERGVRGADTPRLRALSGILEVTVRDLFRPAE